MTIDQLPITDYQLPDARVMITPTHYMLLSAALFMIGVIGVMVRRNIIIIFMSIELILNAVNINLVAFSSAAAERDRAGVRDLRHRGGGGRSGGGARDHPRVLPQQGNGQHRRDEPDAMVRAPRASQGRWADCDRHAIHLADSSAARASAPPSTASSASARSRARRPGLVACATMTLALGLSLVAFWQLLGLPAEARALRRRRRAVDSVDSAADRTTAIGTFQVPWGFRLDPLSGDDAPRRHRHRHADPRLLDRLHGRRAARRRARASSAT